MEILLQDLLPGQEYLIQLRAKNQRGVSQWSRAYSVTTDSDVIAPNPITGLVWDVSRASFIGEWTKPVNDSNGQPLKDFKDFKVTLTADAQTVIFYVVEERFDLTLERNIGSFGSPKPTVEIKVEVRDNIGNLSTAVTDTATNAIPPDVVNFNAEPIPKGVSLSWDPTVSDDLKQYEVYMETSGSGFTPGPGNLIYIGTANQFVYTSANQIVHYFKAREVDLFNQGSNAYVPESATPLGTSDLDTTPPDAPVTVTVTSSTDADGLASIDVSWATVSSTNLRNYIVRYSTDEVTWQYITVPSTDTATTIARLLPDTDYYVGVAGSSYLNTRSSFTNAGTYPITTAADTVAPSTPAAPTVSTSTFNAQVNHDMAKSGGGDLEADVEYLEVHASTTTGFTPDLTTLRGTILSAGQGIDVSAVFEFSPTDSMTNLYWKVIAVDRAKNKSSASAQATGLPGLIDTANIANLAVTNAKVNDLSAAKLTAGTAFINDLFVRSNIVLDSSSGHIQSDNYDVGLETGWSLDQNGLTIFDGTISAAALELQDSQNIAPVAFSDFEFNEEYYHNSSNVANVITSTATSGVLLDTILTPRTGRQSIRVWNTVITNPTAHTYVFAPDGLTGTNANVEVNPGVYILSVYLKKNGIPNQDVKIGLYTDTGVAVQSTAQSVTSTSWTRFTASLTVPSGAQKVKVYLEFGPQAANTGYDFLVDSVQLERKVAGSNDASPWTPPSETRIDGGAIVTGSIRSSAASSTVPGQPAWSINTAGNMQIGDALIRGSLVVGSGAEAASVVQSGNYVANTSGWIIKGDGDVEFNDGSFRGDLNLSTIYDTKQFSVQIGNMDSNFIWYAGDQLAGEEPTLLFQGWSFKPDGIGGFDPVREIQSVVRLTAVGELQFIFDPSHSSDILSVDGNNQNDITGTPLDRYYGWVDKRMGMGTENDTSVVPNSEGREPFGNSYYYDEMAVSRSTATMGSEGDMLSRIQGFAQADGSISKYQPRSEVKLMADSYNDFDSMNMIQDGMDLFDNGGGVSYYNTNTTRNRITLNSILSNIELTYSGEPGGKLVSAIDATLTSAGSGNHSIAFTTGATTYPITVAPGDEYYMTFYGYKPSAQALSYRFFIKTNNGVTTYSSTRTFSSSTSNTIVRQNSNYDLDMDDLLVVPAGVTSAHFGIEFIGTIASNQNLRLTGIQLIKTFATVGGNRTLMANYDEQRFIAVGASFLASSESYINLIADAVPSGYRNVTNLKPYRHSSIELTATENDLSPGSHGLESSTVTLYPTGLKVGGMGEPRLPHGEARTLTSTPVNQFAVTKLTFNNTKTLDTYDSSTISSSWTDMGIAIDNTPGYTTFVPQRAGLFLVSIYLKWNVVTGASEYHVVELIKDSNGAFLGVGKFTAGQANSTTTFVLPLSVGEKVYAQVYHDAAVTRTYDTTSTVSFVQLI